MFLGFIIILWLSIALVVVYFFSRTRKFKPWLRIIWRDKKIKKKFAIAISVLLVIAGTFMLLPQTQDELFDERYFLQDFYRNLIVDLNDAHFFKLDSSCSLENINIELVYAIPAVLKAYETHVKKPTQPRLKELNDSLIFVFEGYKQFKNRGIKITKMLKKKLGNRYQISITSKGANHELKIIYDGSLWRNEQYYILPVASAAKSNNIDPALLMALIKHISDFNMNFKGANNFKGLLALDSGEALEQIPIAAQRIKSKLDSSYTLDDALLALYPNDKNDIHFNTKKKTLQKVWLDEVYKEMHFYKQNGMN